MHSLSQTVGEIKKRLFLATVESVLLHGSEIWSIDKTLCKGLGGCCTRILRIAMNMKTKSDKPVTIWNITNSFVKSCL